MRIKPQWCSPGWSMQKSLVGHVMLFLPNDLAFNVK